MTDFICLKEIELPIVMSSYLKVPNAFWARYCVLAEGCLIIFRRPSDLISLCRVPLNENTKCESRNTNLTVTYLDFVFTFSHSDKSIIESWNSALHASIRENDKKALTSFHAETVLIKIISSSKCHIVIGKTDYKLLIYDSYHHQKSDICHHVINLKFYPNNRIELQENSGRSASKELAIKGMYNKFELTFESSIIALEWKVILRSAFENYLKSPNDLIVLNNIYKNESNKLCADCGEPNPKWVSTNLCITLCDNCAGLHRELGTGVSRTQSAIIDEKCWQDSLLVQLLVEIGNNTANSFWCQNIPFGDYMINIARKYKHKDFMDISYISLGGDEIVRRLMASVVTSTVSETMRLWFSNKSNLAEDVIKELMKRAKESDQALQEKFLKMQENTNITFTYNRESVAPIFEGAFHLSYNSGDRLSNLYLVVLHLNRLVVKAQGGAVSTSEYADVCTIYFNSINMIHYDPLRYSIRVSFYPQCRFLLSNRTQIDVNNINVFDKSESLLKLQTCLFQCLLPHHFDSPTDQTSLFLNTDVRINEGNDLICKCHLTSYNLIFWNPLDMIYDLTKATHIETGDDPHEVIINFSGDTIRLRCHDSNQDLINCLNLATKMKVMSLSVEGVVAKFDALIKFIKFRACCEGVFRIAGNPQAVDDLLLEFTKSGDTFIVNATAYSVHDAIGCLKRCLSLLKEPLVSSNVFKEMRLAVYMENEEDRRFAFTEAIKLMSSPDCGVLKHLVEVLYIVFMRNQVDSGELVMHAAKLGLSRIHEEPLDLTAIVKYLVDNFVFLFNYSEEEQISLLAFEHRHAKPTVTSVLRTFLVGPGLELRATVFSLGNAAVSLAFLGTGCTLTPVTVQTNTFDLVGDVAAHLFGKRVSTTAVLWYFVNVKGKIFKRQLYFRDSVVDAVHAVPVFPAKYRVQESGSFVFLRVEAQDRAVPIMGQYKCGAKIKGVGHSLEMSADSLRIVGNTPRPSRDFELSKVHLYRCHTSSYQLYLLKRDIFIDRCKFSNAEVYSEFLSYFDTFRSKNFRL